MSKTAHSRYDQPYYGVAEGIVAQVNDPEKEGRVKVTFPWFDSQMTSEWCRVATLYAGNGYGSFFVPEVEDEVLVAFVHGDMRMPIVLGGLYNGKDKPSTHKDDQKDEKLIRTRGGHQLLFDDTSGSKQVEITTEGGHKVKLDDQNKAVTVHSSGGHEVVLDDQAKKLTAKTSTGQSITIDGTSGTITLSGMTVSIDAQNIQLGGAGATHPILFGDLFMALFNAHVHTTTLPTQPTSPPVTPLTPAMMSVKSKTG